MKLSDLDGISHLAHVRDKLRGMLSKLDVAQPKLGWLHSVEWRENSDWRLDKKLSIHPLSEWESRSSESRREVLSVRLFESVRDFLKEELAEIEAELKSRGVEMDN